LDSLGCCIAALDAGPVKACREQVIDFGGTGPCALIDGTMGEYRIETDIEKNGSERP
jgi:2-methylcitrate dehydratase PrpD